MRTAFKSYLVRSVYEYCMDHGLVPYIVANVVDNDTLPIEHVQVGKITLNLSNQAIRDFTIDHEQLSFSTRFSGKITFVNISIAAILWIGSPQSDCGMGFEVNEAKTLGAKTYAKQPQQGVSSGSKLRLI